MSEKLLFRDFFLRGRLRRFRSASTLAVAAGLAVATLAGAPGSAQAATAAPDQWSGNFGTAGNTSANLGEHIITASNAGRVRPAFAAANRTDDPYPPVVLGGVVYTTMGGTSPKFVASSPKTGSVLWTMALPAGARNFYSSGMTGTGSTVFVSFAAEPKGGVLAIDLKKRAVIWRSFLPTPTISWLGDDEAGPPITDGTRVFAAGSTNAINAYSAATGAELWTRPIAKDSDGDLLAVDGFALGGGYVYTSGAQGLIAYSASTGKRAWSSTPAWSRGTPMVAAGRVFVRSSGPRVGQNDVIDSFPAAGCGHSTCRPTWTSVVPSDNEVVTEIAGADATNVFVSYETNLPGGPKDCQSAFVGNIARLSTATGKVQWHVAVGDATQGLIRSGSVIWVVNEFVDAKCEGSYRIRGYSVAATHPAPAASIALPFDYYGFPQTISVASGTLFETVRQSTLVGYRIPGT